jgi:predicted CopG family antitoxin
MSRTTITVTDDAFEAADADRRDDESWSDYLQRVAGTEHDPNTVAVENIGEVARAVGDEVESRMRGR